MIGRLCRFLLLFILGSWLILGRFLGVSAEEWLEYPPLLSEEQTPLTLEEIVPEKIPAAQNETADSEADTTKLPLDAKARKALELDKLFYQLKRTANREDATKISGQIQGLWAQSGSDTVDLLMQWAEKAIVSEDYPQALDFLDNVVMLHPEFAEGWMRRASVHIQRHDLTLAMLDLILVLKLESRHYQAMAQLGLIMEMTERKQAAVAVYIRALTLYPQFVRLQSRLDNLLDETTELSL